jgi:hypothetical protein
MSISKHSMRSVLMLLSLAIAPAAIAQTGEDPRPPTREQLMEMIDAALPAVIQEDNAELVGLLLRPRLGDPPSKTFDRATAVRLIFGRLTPTFAPECKKGVTPAGMPDPNECMAFRGSPNGPGAFMALEFSKHPGFGNFNFLKRSADGSVTPASLKPVQLADPDASKAAMQFLVATFGLSTLEMPELAAVKTLTLGFAGQTAGGGLLPPSAIGVQKHVFIQRQAGVDVDGLPVVPVPGRAVVALDDAGVQNALVDGWGDLVPSPGVDPKQAKGRRQLVNEMADEVMTNLESPVGKVHARIQLAGIPDGTSQTLLPAVQLWVSPLPDDLSEAEQATRKTTAGVVHDFMMVEPSEGQGE